MLSERVDRLDGSKEKKRKATPADAAGEINKEITMRGGAERQRGRVPRQVQHVRPNPKHQQRRYPSVCGLSLPFALAVEYHGGVHARVHVLLAVTVLWGYAAVFVGLFDVDALPVQLPIWIVDAVCNCVPFVNAAATIDLWS